MYTWSQYWFNTSYDERQNSIFLPLADTFCCHTKCMTAPYDVSSLLPFSYSLFYCDWLLMSTAVNLYGLKLVTHSWVRNQVSANLMYSIDTDCGHLLSTMKKHATEYSNNEHTVTLQLNSYYQNCTVFFTNLPSFDNLSSTIFWIHSI